MGLFCHPCFHVSNDNTGILRKDGIKMKKSTVRKISLFLAVIFAVSAMPFAVFADDCGVSPCVICQHENTYKYFEYAYTYKNSYYHSVSSYECSACSVCSYVSLRELVSTWTEAHSGGTQGTKYGHASDGTMLYNYDACRYCGAAYIGPEE